MRCVGCSSVSSVHGALSLVLCERAACGCACRARRQRRQTISAGGDGGSVFGTGSVCDNCSVCDSCSICDNGSGSNHGWGVYCRQSAART